MKKDQHNIEQEVERTLTSLDKHQRLEANPYLYTRIKERMANQNGKTDFRILAAHRLQPILFVGLLLLNVFTAYNVFSADRTEEDYFEVLANEYSMEVGDLSEYYILE